MPVTRWTGTVSRRPNSVLAMAERVIPYPNCLVRAANRSAL
jgi:hypothetical protein